MNNLENKEILSDDIIAAMDFIMEKVPNAIFGGSIALNAVGLLNRKVSDIDIFVQERVQNHLDRLIKVSNKEVVEDGLFSDVVDINGNIVERLGLQIKGIKVCCFKVPSDYVQHSSFEINGRKIKIQNVNYAILAKQQYSVKGVQKHINDLKEIDDFFNNLPFLKINKK